MSSVLIMMGKKNIPDSVNEVVEHFSWKSLIVQEKSAQERNVEIIGLIYIYSDAILDFLLFIDCCKKGTFHIFINKQNRCFKRFCEINVLLLLDK